ncbi:uncharacterized protein AAES06_002719 [Glossophaga mutica]
MPAKGARSEGGVCSKSCHIRQVWDHGRSVRQNLAEMGLTVDSNKAVPLCEGHRGGCRGQVSGTHVETQCAKWASEEAFVKESEEDSPGTEWEKVAQLCDFNPKSSKQCKDVSRLRSVLMSLKQTPLSR